MLSRCSIAANWRSLCQVSWQQGHHNLFILRNSKYIHLSWMTSARYTQNYEMQSQVTAPITRFVGPTWGHLGPTEPKWARCWPMNFAIWECSPCYFRRHHPSANIYNNICARVTNCLWAKKEGNFGVYIMRYAATMAMNTTITLGWALVGRVRNHDSVRPAGLDKEFVNRVII